MVVRMSEKRFELSEIYSNTIMDTENCVNNGSHCRMYDIEEVVDLLNKMSEENEQLRKQILNYEKLLSNSYVGEEERLDGWVGKYEIWEDELQEYRKKNTKH